VFPVVPGRLRCPAEISTLCPGVAVPIPIKSAEESTTKRFATVSPSTLNPTKLYAIRTIQTYADRANAAAINSTLTLNKTSGAGMNVNGMVFVINDNSVATTGTGNQVQGVNLTVNRSVTFSTINSSDNLRMFYLQANDFGNYNRNATGSANIYGNLISATFSPTRNPSAETGTLTYSGFGTDIQLSGAPVITAGTMTVNIYGLRVNMAGTTVGTSTGYAFYVQGVSGYDTNWAYYNSTAVSNLMGIDNGKSYWGTGIDASLYYDGTNLVCNPKDVGSGRFKILGNLELSNATPSVIWTDSGGDVVCSSPIIISV